MSAPLSRASSGLEFATIAPDRSCSTELPAARSEFAYPLISTNRVDEFRSRPPAGGPSRKREPQTILKTDERSIHQKPGRVIPPALKRVPHTYCHTPLHARRGASFGPFVPEPSFGSSGNSAQCPNQGRLSAVSLDALVNSSRAPDGDPTLTDRVSL